MRRRMLPLFLAVIACTTVVPTTTHAQAAPKQAGHAVAAPALAPELVTVKAALEKYKDPVVAIHDGFLSTVGCIDFPKGGQDGPIYYPPGAMGVHFLNMSNVGPTLDPSKPVTLVIEQDDEAARPDPKREFMRFFGAAKERNTSATEAVRRIRTLRDEWE